MQKEEKTKKVESKSTKTRSSKGDRRKTPKKHRKSYKKEFGKYKKFWLNVPEEVQYFTERTGMTMRVLRRDTKAHVGQLLRTRWKLEEIELGCLEEERDYLAKEIKTETKIVRIPVSSMMSMEFILDVKVRKEKEQQ